MASVTFEGVRFTVYSNDQPPHHVHGVLGNTVAIVDVLPNGDVRLAKRPKAIRPNNAKRADIRKVLNTAAAHAEELIALWERVHGQT